MQLIHSLQEMQHSLNNHFNGGNSGTRSLFCILCSGLFPLFYGCEKTFIDINIFCPKLCILTSEMMILLIQPNFAKHLNDIIWVPGYSKNHFLPFSPFFLPPSFWLPTKKKKKKTCWILLHKPSLNSVNYHLLSQKFEFSCSQWR